MTAAKEQEKKGSDISVSIPFDSYPQRISEEGVVFHLERRKESKLTIFENHPKTSAVMVKSKA